MFKKILSIIKDEQLKITLIKNSIDITNYKDILTFDDNNIIIDCKDFILKIKGNNLIINKLLDNEVLITGTIEHMEMH